MKRLWWMGSLLLASSVAKATTGDALRFSGDASEVAIVVNGVRVAEGPGYSSEDWIDFDLDGVPAQNVKLDVKDQTVGRIELVGGAHPRLRIQLRGSERTAEQLAARASIESQEGGFRVRLPRDPRHALSAAPTSVVSATTAVATPTVNEAKPAIAAPVKTIALANAPAAPSKVAVEKSEEAPLNLNQASPAATTLGTIPESDTPRHGTLILITLLLGGCGVAALYVRRRQTPRKEQESILVVASRSLGAKTKLVLVAVGGQKLLLSASDRGARLIAKWAERADSDEAAEELETDASHDEEAPSLAELAEWNRKRSEESLGAVPDEAKAEPAVMMSIPLPRSAKRPSSPAPSPAVAGLLKLRQSAFSEDITSGDPEADEEWVRELLAATRAGSAQ